MGCELGNYVHSSEKLCNNISLFCVFLLENFDVILTEADHVWYGFSKTIPS